MKREREKTIRLAMVLVAIITIIAMIMPYYTSQKSEKRQEEIEVSEEETQEEKKVPEEESNDTVLGIILLVGIVTFETGTFIWIRKKEKQGYSFN